MPARKYTPDELMQKLIQWINAVPGRGALFSVAQAARELGVSAPAVMAALLVLEVHKEVRQRHERLARGGLRRAGWSVVRADSEGQNLEALVAAASNAVNEELSLGPGRRAVGDFTPVAEVSPSQLKDLRVAAALIAANCPFAGGDLRLVSEAYLMRRTTDRGVAEWTILGDVAEWSDRRAEARAIRRGELWTPASNAATRAKIVAATRVLLRLALGLGWSGYAGEGVPTIVAVEFESVSRKWRERLVRRQDGTGDSTIRAGIRILLLYATASGARNVRDVNWRSVIASIILDGDAERLHRHSVDCAKYVWRRTHLLSAIEPLPSERDVRIAYLPAGVAVRTRGSVLNAKAREELDFTGWVDEQNAPLTGLIEGKYGLRRWLWYVAADQVYLATDASMPRRGYEVGYRRRRVRRVLSQSAVETKLNVINLLLGWASRHDGVEVNESTDLRELFTPTRLARYVVWRRCQPRALYRGDPTQVAARNLAGVMASVRRMTRDLAQFAEHDGDVESTASLRETASTLTALMVETAKSDAPLKDVIAIDEAWSNQGDPALVKMTQLRDRLIDEAVTIAGLDTAAQLTALRAYRAMPTATAAERRLKSATLAAMRWRKPSWATCLRRAVLFQFMRKVPLRARSLKELRPSMLETRDASGRPAPIWQRGTSVLVQVPGEFTKNHEPYRIAYMAKASAGQEAAEQGAARDLLELYFAPGGALDFLAQGGGDDIDSDFVFVKSARRQVARTPDGSVDGCLHLEEDSFSQDWRSVLLKFGPALGIDVRALKTIQGGLGIHSARSLFGRYWAHVRQMINFVADVLHHGDLQVTKERYVGVDPTSISPDIGEFHDVR